MAHLYQDFIILFHFNIPWSAFWIVTFNNVPPSALTLSYHDLKRSITIALRKTWFTAIVSCYIRKSNNTHFDGRSILIISANSIQFPSFVYFQVLRLEILYDWRRHNKLSHVFIAKFHSKLSHVFIAKFQVYLNYTVIYIRTLIPHPDCILQICRKKTCVIQRESVCCIFSFWRLSAKQEKLADCVSLVSFISFVFQTHKIWHLRVTLALATEIMSNVDKYPVIITKSVILFLSSNFQTKLKSKTTWEDKLKNISHL